MNDHQTKEYLDYDGKIWSSPGTTISPNFAPRFGAQTSISYYRFDAEQGDVRAQFNLGYMYETGKGVSQNHKLAVTWYSLAAEQGYAPAQFNLAVMYRNGQGVPQNDKTALKWYTLAAEQGYAHAQNNLKRLENHIAERASVDS
tara:strand:- start:1193 stop:1624 length:432 start_codon:yes stop_codon:yes gene_type:complete